METKNQTPILRAAHRIAVSPLQRVSKKKKLTPAEDPAYETLAKTDQAELDSLNNTPLEKSADDLIAQSAITSATIRSSVAAIVPEALLAKHENIDRPEEAANSDSGTAQEPLNLTSNPELNNESVKELCLAQDTTSSSETPDKTPNKTSAHIENPYPRLGEAVSLQNLNHDFWLINFASVPANGIVANVLANTQILSVEGTVIELRLDVNQSAVFGDELLERIEAVFSDWLEQKIAVKVEIADVNKETPALFNQRLRAEKHAEMVMDFEQDSTVQDLLTRFSGAIVKDSISSIKAKDNNKGRR